MMNVAKPMPESHHLGMFFHKPIHPAGHFKSSNPLLYTGKSKTSSCKQRHVTQPRCSKFQSTPKSLDKYWLLHRCIPFISHGKYGVLYFQKLSNLLFFSSSLVLEIESHVFVRQKSLGFSNFSNWSHVADLSHGLFLNP